MTKQEILTRLVCAYIQGCGKFLKLDPNGDLNEAWYATVDAIYTAYPEQPLTKKSNPVENTTEPNIERDYVY